MSKKLFLLISVVVILSLVFSFSLTSCTEEVKEEEAAAEEEPSEEVVEILFIPFTMEHVFQKELCDGAQIPRDNVKVYVEDPYGDIEKEVDILEAYLGRGIDAVIMYPIDSEALISIVQDYNDAGIWVLTTGNRVEGEDISMGMDEWDGGIMAADMFMKWWPEYKPEEDPYILLLDIPLIPEPQRKMDAFKEIISENMPESTIVNADGGGDSEQSLVATEQLLQAHPEINFIFGINASSTLGGIAAAEDAGRFDIAHASCGAEPPILALLKEPLHADGGGAFWDIGYGKSAVEYGNHLVDVAVSIIEDGGIKDQEIIMGFQEVWRDNVDEVIDEMQIWREKAGLEPVDF